MDKKIEEMAKSYCINKYKCNTDCVFQKTEVCEIYETCENLYNAGYRKIPEGAVVLTKEEYEELQVGKDFNYGYHNGESNMTAYYENIRLPEVHKDTAKEIYQEIDKSDILVVETQEYGE